MLFNRCYQRLAILKVPLNSAMFCFCGDQVRCALSSDFDIDESCEWKLALPHFCFRGPKYGLVRDLYSDEPRCPVGMSFCDSLKSEHRLSVAECSTPGLSIWSMNFATHLRRSREPAEIVPLSRAVHFGASSNLGWTPKVLSYRVGIWLRSATKATKCPKERRFAVSWQRRHVRPPLQANTAQIGGTNG